MVTDDAFRRAARSLPDVVEAQVMATTEFRLKRRSFATLGWPEAGWAVVRLSADDQAAFLSESAAFRHEPVRRRGRGVTRVRLGALDPNLLIPLLEAAWQAASVSTSSDLSASPRRR